MYAAPRRQRIASALAAAATTALVGAGLLLGLAVRQGTAVFDALKTFAVSPPPPPPPARLVERPRVSTRPEGRAAPPNIRSKATQVVAPVPVVVVPLPPPLVAAPRPFDGRQATQGAADRVGPGTGAGGVGDGTGSGGWGDGDGGGGLERGPRRRRGDLYTSDLPDALTEQAFHGTVGVKFLVWADGRVRDCTVTRSSGDARIDALTCRLIQRRFRYDPARDEGGAKVPSYVVENHEWVFDVEEPPPSR